MTLDPQIESALADPRNAAFLAQIPSTLQISYRPAVERYWMAERLSDGSAVITYCPCREPAASLAHELLHLLTQIRGYRRLAGVVAHKDCVTPYLTTVVDALNNHLQHHKFFREYCDAGFDPSNFYNDGDEKSADELLRRARVGAGSDLEVLVNFLTTIGPGGRVPQATLRRVRQSWIDYAGGQFRDALLTIQASIFDWSRGPSLDPTETVRAIMRAIWPSSKRIWFGFDLRDIRPETGFFVNEAFALRSGS